ncbi:MAG: hypothetical protein EOP67_01085 [Sphingomonas sp.]|nr:MAG: hypothetical protein EOP67_01085 [Sphingomonas sp.]
MTDTPSPLAPDRALLLAALPSPARPPIETLFALDSRLAGIVRATREPMVGQMRLTWWHEALTKLDREPAPAEPLLRDVQRHLLPAGVSGARRQRATQARGRRSPPAAHWRVDLR